MRWRAQVLPELWLAWHHARWRKPTPSIFGKAWDLANLWCAVFVIKKQFADSAAAAPLSASIGERDGARCRSDAEPSNLSDQPLAMVGMADVYAVWRLTASMEAVNPFHTVVFELASTSPAEDGNKGADSGVRSLLNPSVAEPKRWILGRG